MDLVQSVCAGQKMRPTAVGFQGKFKAVVLAVNHLFRYARREPGAHFLRKTVFTGTGMTYCCGPDRCRSRSERNTLL